MYKYLVFEDRVGHFTRNSYFLRIGIPQSHGHQWQSCHQLSCLDTHCEQCNRALSEPGKEP